VPVFEFVFDFSSTPWGTRRVQAVKALSSAKAEFSKRLVARKTKKFLTAPLEIRIEELGKWFETIVAVRALSHIEAGLQADRGHEQRRLTLL
jgi:hypothetical protein